MKLPAARHLAIFAVCWSSLGASSIYNESVSGDLSNSGSIPTSISVSLGSNEVLGTTGRGANGIDRDYFTITVPTGTALTAITVLPGTVSGGAVSFIGLEAGSQVTLPTNPPDATGLLGWWHYSPADINTNILPKMAIPANNSSGFTPPLQAGSYSFWIQDFNAGTFNYGFDLTVSQVPEPGTLASGLLALGLVLLSATKRFRSAS